MVVDTGDGSSAREQQRLPRNRGLQFTLGSLCLLISAICLGLGLVVVRQQNAEERCRGAFAAIAAVGGRIIYKSDSNDTQIRTRLGDNSAPSKGWFTFSKKEERIEDVTCVTFFDNDECTDDVLAALCAFPKIDSLFIRGPRVTDEGLRELRHLRQLKLVDLRGTRVTTKGVRDLQLRLPDCCVFER